MEELTIDGFTESVGRTAARLENDALMDALIGSKILEFSLEKIANRKRMYWLYIRTDAPPIPCIDVEIENTALKFVPSTNTFRIPSEIKLKVKI